MVEYGECLEGPTCDPHRYSPVCSGQSEVKYAIFLDSGAWEASYTKPRASTFISITLRAASPTPLVSTSATGTTPHDRSQEQNGDPDPITAQPGSGGLRTCAECVLQ